MMAARSQRTRATPAPSSARVAISVAIPCRRWRKALPDVERVATTAARAAWRGALAAPGRAAPAREPGRAAELSLVLGGDPLVRSLNRRWRGHDRATNVLSFPAGPEAGRAGPILLGDVVLAYETVAREAETQGKALAAHLSHLVAHGVLHLLGFDHENDAEAQRMEGLERHILARLGMADPYRVREAAHG
jgi:probable rRNA maturation factor